MLVGGYLMGKLLFRFLTTIVLLIVIAAVGLFAFFYYSQYEPEAVEQVHIRNPQQQILIPDTLYTITTLNIGYGASDSSKHILDDIQSIPIVLNDISTQEVSSNIDSLSKQLKALQSDFYVLQEVDQNAKRSHFINENEKLYLPFIDYSAAFTYNYNSPYIPLPIAQPLGQLESGLLTFSRFASEAQSRIALPSTTDFMNKLTEPNFSILETVLPVRGNKYLVIANLQLAGHYSSEEVNAQQLTFIEQYVMNHISKNHYLILAGDWNHIVEGTVFKSNEAWPSYLKKLPESFKPVHMTWAIDSSTPTTRSILQSYQKDYTFTTITDGFLVSNSIEVVSTTTSDTAFRYSSHQPVTLAFRLKY